MRAPALSSPCGALLRAARGRQLLHHLFEAEARRRLARRELLERWRAGAIDFLTKPVDAAELLVVVERALQRDAMARDEHTQREIVLQRLAGLTPRELEVLNQVVVGRLNKQIAGDLGTAEKTVKVHRGRMMKKMGVRNLAELIRIVALCR